MKNDIDSILNSLFSGGKLNAGSGARSRAAQEAEEFLKRIEETDKGMHRGLDRQISDLERINDEAQRSMAEMRRLLENDGASTAEEVKEEAQIQADSFRIQIFLQDYGWIFVTLLLQVTLGIMLWRYNKKK